jgi:hypothetical protein
VSSRKELVDLGIFVTLQVFIDHLSILPDPVHHENGEPIEESECIFQNERLGCLSKQPAIRNSQ